jgi:hypothetical protein
MLRGMVWYLGEVFAWGESLHDMWMEDVRGLLPSFSFYSVHISFFILFPIFSLISLSNSCPNLFFIFLVEYLVIHCFLFCFSQDLSFHLLEYRNIYYNWSKSQKLHSKVYSNSISPDLHYDLT